MHNILIIDDHPIFRHAITMVIQQRFTESRLFEAGSIEQGLAVLAEQDRIDMVLLDLNMPNTAGLSGLLDIRNSYPDVQVVIISAESDKQQILQTISFGAVGFISKSSSVEEIADSIESIFAGNVSLPSDLLRMNTDSKKSVQDQSISADKIRSLTRKELIVLKHLTQGLANKVIAYEMNISETTVKSHVSSILKKLGVSNRVKVVAGAANIDLDQY